MNQLPRVRQQVEQGQVERVTLQERGDAAVLPLTGGRLVVMGGRASARGTHRDDGLAVDSTGRASRAIPSAQLSPKPATLDAWGFGDSILIAGVQCLGGGFSEAAEGIVCQRIQISTAEFDFQTNLWKPVQNPIPVKSSPDEVVALPEVRFIRGSAGTPTLFISGPQLDLSVILEFRQGAWVERPQAPDGVGYICRSGETLYAEARVPAEPREAGMTIGLAPPSDVKLWQISPLATTWTEVPAPPLQRESTADDPLLGCTDGGAQLVQTTGGELRVTDLRSTKVARVGVAGILSQISSSPYAIAFLTSEGDDGLVDAATGRISRLASVLPGSVTASDAADGPVVVRRSNGGELVLQFVHGGA